MFFNPPPQIEWRIWFMVLIASNWWNCITTFKFSNWIIGITWRANEKNNQMPDKDGIACQALPHKISSLHTVPYIRHEKTANWIYQCEIMCWNSPFFNKKAAACRKPLLLTCSGIKNCSLASCFMWYWNSCSDKSSEVFNSQHGIWGCSCIIMPFYPPIAELMRTYKFPSLE